MHTDMHVWFVELLWGTIPVCRTVFIFKYCLCFQVEQFVKFLKDATVILTTLWPHFWRSRYYIHTTAHFTSPWQQAGQSGCWSASLVCHVGGCWGDLGLGKPSISDDSSVYFPEGPGVAVRMTFWCIEQNRKPTATCLLSYIGTHVDVWASR